MQTETNTLQCCQPIKSHLSLIFCLLILIERGEKLLNIRTAFCNDGGNLCIITLKISKSKKIQNVIFFGNSKNGKLYN